MFFEVFFFLNRNTEIRTQRNKIFARKKTKKRKKLKVMHEKTNQKQKIVKITKTRVFPRVLFLTRINDIFLKVVSKNNDIFFEETRKEDR